MVNEINNELCCYCGVREATTRDHVPPKSIFNRPRPSDLITVPCCFQCNNEASKYDERFKVYLGLHVSSGGDKEAERLFREGVIPTVQHNKKLNNGVRANMFSLQTSTNENAKAIRWDNEAHNITIERITKGLFFHHYEKIIPSDISIQTYWFKEDQLRNVDDKLYSNVIANGAFEYRYNKAHGLAFDSIWLFTFYGKHFAGGIIKAQ